ncbi:Meiotically up-regulated gene protein [Cladobotryum mycophilum]|uniref:Meiotically up-regulated gene protein n=1 Tax=Cladobotryum mycophilum TaxID=491253 RepID=A0ABR0SNX8_9HYPO
MPVSIKALLADYEYDPNAVQHVAVPKSQHPISIVDPDPSWPQQFQDLKARIQNALGAVALSVAHRGSTSVPGLPAKNVIDMDLTVPDPADEASYVGPLEAAGFQFILREPTWHQHRFFRGYEPSANLHVWGPDCPEVERHRIFHEWLLAHEDDRELYAQVKREAAQATNEVDGSVMDYNLRKEFVIREILQRAFRGLGYIQ